MSEDLFKEIMQQAADAEGIKPHQVTRFLFRKHEAGRLGGYAMDKMGGFGYLKERLTPQPPGPFDLEGIKGWTKREFTQLVVDLIKQAAVHRDSPEHEITWDEFRQFINMRWGVNDRGIPKYMITKCGGFNNIRDAHFQIAPTEIVVHKRQTAIGAQLNRKEGVENADRQFIFDNLDAWAEKFKGTFNRSRKYEIPTLQTNTARALNLLISDTHFGSDLDPSEVGMAYGMTQEARRLASVAKQAIEFYDKPHEIELNLWINGDIFQGQLHDMRDGSPLAEQMARSIWLLGQLVQLLAEHFLRVNVRFATGNHGRSKQRHHGRGVNQKWDSLETPVYYAVKYACSGIKNVLFDLPKTPFVTGVVQGHKIFCSHGDTVFAPGVPQKSVNMKELAYQAAKFNMSLKSLDLYAAFLFGHIHSTCFTDPTGVNFVINSCLVPSDAFALSIGSPEVQCAQTLFESRESNAVFCLAPLRVGLAEDLDETLDKLIRPWAGF